MNRRRMVVLAASLLALAGAGIASYAMLSAYWPGATKGVSQDGPKGPNAIAALGRIEPRSGIINLGAGSGPDRLESLSVDRGDLVKKGDILGYLAGYAEQIAQRDVIRAQLNEVRLRHDTELRLNQARIRAAELRRRKVLEVTPHRIAAQEATIAALENKNANSKDILAAREVLLELKAQFTVDQEESEVQVRVAHASLERSDAEFPQTSLAQQLTLAETRAKRLTLYAPIDGRVLNVRVRPGEDIGTGPILVLGDTSRMQVVAEVYETDIAQVSIDQTATVSSRALPRPISGRVARIGNMVYKNDVLNVDPAARADARVVEVWINLDEMPFAERLTNLTVDVVIALDRRAAIIGSRTP